MTLFNDDLKTLSDNMIETMYQHNGVGLAGPQIGVAKRLFIALEIDKDLASSEEDAPAPETQEQKRKRWGVVKEHVIINPSILHKEGEAQDMEGCLSIPGLYIEDIARPYKIHLRYQDILGSNKELKAEGHFARVILHELDHLNGKLFFDHLDQKNKQSFIEEHRQTLADMQREAKAYLKDLKTSPVPGIR